MLFGMLIISSFLWYFERCVHDFFFSLINLWGLLFGVLLIVYFLWYFESGEWFFSLIKFKVCYFVSSILGISFEILKGVLMIFSSLIKVQGVLFGVLIAASLLWYFERFAHDCFFCLVKNKVCYLVYSFLFLFSNILKGVLLGGLIIDFPLWYFESCVHDFSFLKSNHKVLSLVSLH